MILRAGRLGVEGYGMWQEEGGTKEDSGDLIFTFNHTASPRLTTKLKGVRLSWALGPESVLACWFYRNSRRKPLTLLFQVLGALKGKIHMGLIGRTAYPWVTLP